MSAEPEFEYEAPDYSVGLSGGWVHALCQLDDQEVHDDLLSWRLDGEGWQRVVVSQLLLTCSCGASAEVTTTESDPDIPADLEEAS